MSKNQLKKTAALGLFTMLLLAEFSMFQDFFYPFRFMWDQGRIIDLALSLVLFFWSLSGAFLIFFSDRSLFRKITLPFFLFFFLFNVGSFQVSHSPIDIQQALLIVENFQWWLGAVVENIGLAVLPLLIILIPVGIVFVFQLAPQ